MEIILIRYCYSRWGVMGALYIDGLCICHTCEHPDRHLSVGKYDVKKERERLRIVGSPQGGYHCLPVFRPGNGPFVYRDGSIIVEKYRASGLLIHSQASYAMLYMRIDRCNKSNKSIRLLVIDKNKYRYFTVLRFK